VRVDVAVVGKANVDFLVRGPRLPGPGQSVNGEEFQVAPGGKGANQAIAARRLGARVGLVARVGTDGRAEAVLSALREEGVDLEFVRRDPDATTGVAVVQVARSGEKQILSYPGANARLTAADVRAAAPLIEGARVLLVQLGVPLPAVEEAVRLGRAAGVRVVLDPGPPTPISDALIAQLDLIRPNRSEAEALTGVTVRDRDTALQAARLLLQRGAKAAAVQAGEHGDLLLWRDDGGHREHWLPRFEVPRVDATGAGDAFAAGLAVGLAEGLPLPEAGRIASAAAALATTKLGAQAGLPRRAAVEALLHGVHSE
jgi:ribokinase